MEKEETWWTAEDDVRCGTMMEGGCGRKWQKDDCFT